MPTGMPSDELLVEGIRQALSRRRGVSENRMFVGVCFMVNDNLMLLLQGDDPVAEALTQPHTREMNFTRKPIKSMTYVKPEGYDAG